MKKLLCLLMAMIMLVSCVPMGIFASGASYYVAGVGALCGSEWNPGDEANKMTLDSDGLYKKTYENVPAGSYEFKVTDGTWDNCWGNGGNNYAFNLPVMSNVTITFDANTKAINVIHDGDKEYFIAGVGALCGSEWACDDPANKLTLDTDGLYKKTYENVPAGTYEFKVTDGTWNNSWGNGGSNFAFTLLEQTDVTITFDAFSKEISVIHEGQKQFFVAGVGALCGSEWNPGDPANQMTLDTDGLYKKSYQNVPAGSYEFKVTDGTWSNCWGKDGNNFTFTLTEQANIVITFNHVTKEIQVVEATVVPYYVAGYGSLCGSDWDPGNEANKMDLDTDGLYKKTYKSVPAGTYEFKITDGTWNNSWGNGGNNYSFTLEAESNVTITFDDATKSIGLIVVAVEPYYVAGNSSLCGSEWACDDEANKMELDTDGLYKKTFCNVPAGVHEFKITNGTWDKSWGDGGNNYRITTQEAHDVTITFNAATKAIAVILSDPTGGEDTEPEVYDIEIRVHYYRPDGDYGPWEVHMWNGVASLSATRPFTLEEVTYKGVTYGATATYYADAADTWVGFIIKKPDWTKDPDGDRKVDLSDVTGGVVHVYAKTGSKLEDFVVDKSEAQLGAKVVSAVYDYKTGGIEITTSYPIENPGIDTFTLESSDGPMTVTGLETVGEKVYLMSYEGVLEETKVYTVYYNGLPCVVTVPNVYSTEDFEAEYTYKGNDLGANWTASGTTFRLWAPTAAAVSVNLYASGTAGTDDLLGSYGMVQDVNGTWIVTVDGDLHGVYYTYSVTRKGETVEAVDPYARTTGVNGDRGMVVNLDATDPAGWENDTYVTQASYTDAVIWELHVRDFSIDDSSGMVNKGKYLAFTESGTVVPGTSISTGVDYMVQLGVNYVHLLPVYDINSVDETVGGYNWGYDPKNYNVPEGSYSTDPYNGAVRVTEFKQMVQALHNNGIGVVMDVVYNHVADGENFCFNQIVPGYFSRIQDDGSYQSNSGCGNDTATERAMVRKYIVDSILYWVEEYHIDGFRWDLVGLIDYETINEVMAEVHKIHPEIMFYGEGWEMCTWTTKEGYTDKMTIQPNDHMVNTDAGVFAFFNDTIRNSIHGGVFVATDKGFVSGNMSEGMKETVTMGYMGNSNWGSNNSSVDTPLQTINYASCHDNYTLFDNLTIDVMDAYGVTAEEAAELAAAMNNLAAAYYITAQGVPFIHAGEEMLRSKPDDAQSNGFNHNSYAAGDAINAIKWDSLTQDLQADTAEYYKGLIAFRKAHPALRMTSEAAVQKASTVLKTGNNNVIAVLNNGGKAEDADILSIFNADSVAHTVNLPSGQWNVYVNKDSAGTEILATVEGKIEVEATSALILVKVAGTGDNPPTGDAFQLLTVSAVAMVSLAACAAFVTLRRRNLF